MRCPFCGADVPEKPFCENCGKSFAVEAPAVDPKATVDRIFASVGLPSSDAPVEPAAQGDQAPRLGGAMPVATDSPFGEPIKAPGSVYSVEPFSMPRVDEPPVASDDHAPESFSVPKKSRGRVVAAIVVAVVVALVAGVAIFMGLSNGQVSSARSSAAEVSQGATQSPSSAMAATTSESPSSASAESTSSPSAASEPSGSSASSASASADSSSASKSSSASAAASASVSASSASSGPSKKAKVDPKCFDANGNASLYLANELDGKAMKEALEQNEYSWVAGASAWMTQSGAIVEVQDADGPMSDKKLAKLKKGAAGTPAVFVIMTNGYGSPQDALQGMSSGVTVNDTVAYDDDITFARISGSSGSEMLVVVTRTSGEQQTFLVFNNDAISNGLFTKIVGTATGNTIDEIWKVVSK